jgi:Tfp pilus assembly protein PilO
VWGIQFLIGIVIAVAMGAGFYLFCYTPTNKKIELTRRQIEAEERALQTVRTQAPLLKPMTEKVKWLEQQLVVYKAKIAGKGEVISLIKTIEEEAQRLGLKVINMHTREEVPPSHNIDESSSAPVQEPAYAKIVLSSYLQADYYKLEDFLDTLQRLESFVVVESIDVDASDSEEMGSELALNLEMSLYNKKEVDSTYVAKNY